jgi:hypothetical protein
MENKTNPAHTKHFNVTCEDKKKSLKIKVKN